MKQLKLLVCLLFLSFYTLGQEYPGLDLSMNQDTIKIDEGEQYVLLEFKASETMDILEARTRINNYLRSSGCDWLAVETITPCTYYPGKLRIKVSSHPGGPMRVARFLDRWGRDRFVCQYEAGALPRDFYVGCREKMIYPGKQARVILTGSESGVNYVLYNDTREVASLSGTGSELVFPVDTAGTYKVQAVRGNIKRDMTGALGYNGTRCWWEKSRHRAPRVIFFVRTRCSCTIRSRYPRIVPRECGTWRQSSTLAWRGNPRVGIPRSFCPCTMIPVTCFTGN